MYIIIDTNIFYEDFSLNSINFLIFKDFIQKSQTRLIFPSIILEEIESKYKFRLSQQLASTNSKIKSLNNLTPTLNHQQILVDVDENVTNYITYLKTTFKINDSNTINYNNELLPVLVKRSLKKQKPNSEKKESFRDSIIWLTILEFLKNKPTKELTFISKNKSDFGDKEGNLHSELLAETKALGYKILYYSTLELFNKSIASPIDFITNDWIVKNVDDQRILKILESELNESWGHKKLLNMLSNYGGKPLSIQMIEPLGLELSDFSVYEMIDKTIRVRLEYEIEVEVEYDTDNDISEDVYEDDLLRIYNFIEKTKMQSATPIVVCSYEVHIEDKEIIECEFGDIISFL